MHGLRTRAGQAGQGRCTARMALLAGALAAGLAAALAGCGSGQAHVALPRKPPPVRVAAHPSRPSATQLVVTAYDGYWRATNQALDSGSAAAARKILAGVVPAGAIAGLVKGLQVLWGRDDVSYGSPVLHIMSVKITGKGTAAVHDCVDMSHTGLANRQTGQIVGALGQSHDYLITTLVQQHGRWLVTGSVPVVQSCSY